MATYATLGGKNLLDPGVLMGHAQRLDTPKDFWKRANSYRNPLGPAAGTAWVLMVREDLDQLDKNGKHDLVFIDGKDILTIQELSMVKATGMNLALKDDKNAAYLVGLQDKRRLLAMSSINSQYNVRIPAPSATSGTGLYYTASLDSGSLWTWQTMLTDIWSNLPSGIRGTAPTLPYR